VEYALKNLFGEEAAVAQVQKQGKDWEETVTNGASLR
jgi:hypothetical protein